VVDRYLKASEVAGISQLSPSVVDVDDMDTLVLFGRMNSDATPHWQRPFIRWKLAQLQSIFPDLLQNYGCCWVSKAEDAEQLRLKSIRVVANSFQPTKSNVLLKSSPKSYKILWVGSFNHRVNLEGMDRFIRVLWPRIHSQCSHACLQVVGSHLPMRVREPWSKVPGVDVIGFVETLDSWYANCSFCVVPVKDGAGTKIKVLEALSRNRTLLLTDYAAKGFFEFEPEKSLMIAESDEAFVTKALLLMEDTALRHQLESHGRNQVNRLFGFDSICHQVDAALA
jgi:glycosyltransferase involved in cell wall biosynthesis